VKPQTLRSRTRPRPLLVRIELERLVRSRQPSLVWLILLFLTAHAGGPAPLFGWTSLTAALGLGCSLGLSPPEQAWPGSAAAWLVSRGVDRLELLGARAAALAIGCTLVALLLGASLLARGPAFAADRALLFAMVLLVLLAGAADQLAAGPTPRPRRALLLGALLVAVVPMLLHAPLWVATLAALPLLLRTAWNALERWHQAEL
jgi:hypothetical protein